MGIKYSQIIMVSPHGYLLDSFVPPWGLCSAVIPHRAGALPLLIPLHSSMDFRQDRRISGISHNREKIAPLWTHHPLQLT